MDIQINAVANSAAIAATQVDRQSSSQAAAVSGKYADTSKAGQAASSVKADNSQVKDAVGKVNEMIGGLARGLEFSVDDETNIQIVKVVDAQSREVIRQIPSEEIVNIAKALDKLQGLLLRDKA